MPITYLKKYGAAATLDFPLFAADGIDLQPAATFAAGDVRIGKDEAAEVDTTNLPVDRGQGYSLDLTAAEMQAARIAIYLVDQSATKEWLDDVLIIETYGHASAGHAFDLDEPALTAAQINAEVDTALADYDAPTKAELDARTLPAAQYATASNQTALLDRIGAFAGSGVNTVLGFFRALLRSDAALPTDVGGAYDPASHSLQAIAASGGGGPTAEQIADEVWNRSQSEHTTAGTFGFYLDAAISGISGASGGSAGASGNYIADLNAARDNIAAQLADLTTNPKPSYSIDGQQISWDAHFRALSQELDRLNLLIQAAEPYEIRTQGDSQ